MREEPRPAPPPADQTDQTDQALAEPWTAPTTERRWGEAIPPERQIELEARLQAWADEGEAGHGQGTSPFAWDNWRQQLTGADVFYLAARALAGPDGDAAALQRAATQLRNKEQRYFLDLSALHLERASLMGAHLEGADLHEAHLERASLVGASFDKASRLNDAVLTGASFDQVRFENTNLTVLDWSLVDRLGDERTARAAKYYGIEGIA